MFSVVKFLLIDDVTLFLFCVFFFFKQKTAYEMRISDWSSDVCSSDLLLRSVAEPQQLTYFVECHVERQAVANESQAIDQRCIVDEIGRASCRERVCQYV